MPYIKDKNLVNIYEEVDKANQTIGKLTDLLRSEEEHNSILKKHRVILGIFGLLLLLLFLWSFLAKDELVDKNYLKKNNLTLIDTDSLESIKSSLEFSLDTKLNNELLDDSLEDDNIGMAGETIVYSVQIGAFTNFKAKLFSDDLAHLKEFREGGLNKYALGNFISYAEAKVFKRRLKTIRI